MSLSGSHGAERLAAIEQSSLNGTLDLSAVTADIEDSDWSQRRAIVHFLANGCAATIELLVQALTRQRSHEATISVIVDALSATPHPLERLVAELAESENPAVVCDALQILGRRGLPASIPLLAAATRHADDNVALAAIEALGRIGGREVVDALLVVVQSGTFFRTFPAIDALGRSSDTRALSVLLTLLPSELYAGEVARALGRLGDVSAVKPLLDRLAEGNDAFVRIVASALVAIHRRSRERFGTGRLVERALLGHPRVAFIRRRFESGVARADASEQLALSEVLGFIGETETVRTLLSLLDGPADVAEAATRGLERLASVGESDLIAAVAQGSSTRRRALIPLLGGAAAARDTLLLCLRDDEPVVRALACDALARIGDPRVVTSIFPLLTDSEAPVAQSALAAVHSLGSDQVQTFVLSAVDSKNLGLRRAALRIIGYFGYPQALPAIEAALADVDERVRDTALGALPSFDAAAAQALGLKALRHDSAKTRAAACRALGHVEPSDATLRGLGAALEDPDSWVRYYACQALGRLRDATKSARIAALVRDPAGQVRMAALDALSRMPDAAAFATLLACADESDVDVQRAALVALGISKRVEAIPVLRRALDSPEPATSIVAISALSQFEAPESAEAVVDSLRAADARKRTAALAFFASRKGAFASEQLILLLSEQPDRLDVISALAEPVAGRAEAISAALQGASDELAAALVSALARSATPAALSELRLALGALSAASRRAAAAALIALGDDLARPSLEQAALHDLDPEVRRIAAGAFYP